MTDWLRLWHDMPTDPKWRTISRKSGQPLPYVIAVFNLVLVNASMNASDRGTLRNWKNEDAAAALDIDEEAVNSIMLAMDGRVIENGRLSGWENRQPKREDGTSAQRKEAWKNRNALERIGTHRNAPDTDTDTDTDTENKDNSLRSLSSADSPKEKSHARKSFNARSALIALECDEKHIDGWIKIRSAQKAPLTEAAIDAINREAEKAGISAAFAVQLCAERGWRYFQADYKFERPSTTGPPKSAQIFVQEDSPAFAAWRDYRKKRGQMTATARECRENGYKRGWYFETEYPPRE